MLLNLITIKKSLKKSFKKVDLTHKEGNKNKNLETLWNEIKSPIINTIKLDIINKKSTEIF